MIGYIYISPVESPFGQGLDVLDGSSFFVHFNSTFGSAIGKSARSVISRTLSIQTEIFLCRKKETSLCSSVIEILTNNWNHLNNSSFLLLYTKLKITDF